MSAAYYVRRLTGKERRELEEICRRRDDARVYQRAQAVLLSADRTTTREIGRIVRRCHSTVFRWLKKFDEVGLAACMPGKSPGRPPKVDAAVQATLESAVRQNPRDLGLPFTRWTTALLAEHVHQQHDLELHRATVGVVLRRLRFRYGCPKLDLKHRQDPVDVARARRQRNRALKKRRSSASTRRFCISTRPSFT
jgi:transposase